MMDIENSVNEKRQVVRLMARSWQESLSIGIRSKLLGSGTHIVCVADIKLVDEIVFELKPYDASGKMLEVNRLKLSQIECVIPLTSRFENPFFKTIVHSRPIQ
jgi:hypothetical protein